MAILSSSEDSFGGVSMMFTAWLLNFIATLVGLFISLYFLISHDDLNSNYIAPIELCNCINLVSLISLSFSTFLSNTYAQLCTYFSQCSMRHGTFCFWVCLSSRTMWNLIWDAIIGSTSLRQRNTTKASTSWKISSSGKVASTAYVRLQTSSWWY